MTNMSVCLGFNTKNIFFLRQTHSICVSPALSPSLFNIFLQMTKPQLFKIFIFFLRSAQIKEKCFDKTNTKQKGYEKKLNKLNGCCLPLRENKIKVMLLPKRLSTNASNEKPHIIEMNRKFMKSDNLLVISINKC